MTDPKPYTPEDVARLFHEKGRPDWGHPGTGVEVDPQRLEATVQALAAAHQVLDALMSYGGQRAPHPIGDLAHVELPWAAWENLSGQWTAGGGADRLHSLLGLDEEEASDGTAERLAELRAAMPTMTDQKQPYASLAEWEEADAGEVAWCHCPRISDRVTATLRVLFARVAELEESLERAGDQLMGEDL